MYRASISATSKEELITKLDSAIRDKEQSTTTTKAKKVANIRMLGVFTGQGAQWATMGASLLLHCKSFRHTIQQLELVLKGLRDGPIWSLTEELVQNDPIRTLSAEISQPLCTAIQVALVDLLSECGITFNAVIGHSSGEIAAAYAAGVLSARDAILAAYYRGYHCRRVHYLDGKRGKMMAVGMAPQDAETFCQQLHLSGRIKVAAKNSPSSVTLSGDARSIVNAKAILDDKAVFARVLMIDNAYHSHHMEPVREPYLASLKEANFSPKRNCFEGNCNWYSTVYSTADTESMTRPISFESTYWTENMTNPVLFSDAITSAIRRENFDLVLEIGPHPALRGPATECLKDILGNTLPYQGVLERNKDALNSFSDALGFVWKNNDSLTPTVDFAGFRRACDGPNWTMPRVHKQLPTYPWDHKRPMLKESRKSKAWRTRNIPGHELLGYPSPSGNSNEVRWRNILRINDVEWLQGHKFQNQVLLPAAGYLVMAVNAALYVVGQGQSAQLIELQDVVIHNGITLEEDSPGVDINFMIRLIDDNPVNKTAEFSCHCSNVDAAAPRFDKQVFTGRVFVKLGPPVKDALPDRLTPNLPMTDVTTDRFYSWMQRIGLQYSDPFVLDSIKRRMNLADQYTIHPGTLDSIFQGLYAAFSYPGDGRVWTTYLPKSFRRVRFNMNACWQTNHCANSPLVADCYLTEASASIMCGDINVFCAEGGHPGIQAQGVVLSSLEVPTAANDCSMFWKTIWKGDVLSGVEPAEDSGIQTPLANDRELHEICERTSYFYLNQLCREFQRKEIQPTEWHLQYLMHWALNHICPTGQSGSHPLWEDNWESDTLESIMKLKEHHYDGQIDLELIHHLGPQLPNILSGSKSTLQVLQESDMLETLYTKGLGVQETNAHLGRIQYPRLRVLEVGAGTGGSTCVALHHLGANIENYTFTDISPAFFPAAQSRFAEYAGVTTFHVLNIERRPLEQGFQAHSYDLIIAAHVLHATRSISKTIQNCRELLRPGGYLILLELTSTTTLRIPFMFSGLPGWWLGREDGRDRSPTLTGAQWDAILRNNLFSGVDRALPDFEDDCMHSFSVMLSQAIDDRIRILREPLTLGSDPACIGKLFIINGRTLSLSRLANGIQSHLNPFAEQTMVINCLEDVLRSSLEYGCAVICLSGLEEATFAQINSQRLSAMQSLFRQAKYIIWATRGCRDDDPYANIMIGIGRSVSREMAHLRLKFVDVDHVHLKEHRAMATMFSEMLLQMICLDLPTYDNILWSNETEVAVEDGAVVIPRVIQDDALNHRFNSTRRRITKTVSSISVPVEMSTRDDRLVIEKVKSDPEQSLSHLHVLSSSLFCFACADDDRPFYICLGYSPTDDKRKLLAISETNGSSITMGADKTFPFNCNTNVNEGLSAILAVIVCESLLSGSTGTVWIHNADDCTAEIICSMAEHKDVPVFLTTSNGSSTLASTGKATYVHPCAAERELRPLIPPNLKRFIDMGVNVDGLVEFAATLADYKVGFQKGVYYANLKQIIPLSYGKSSLTKILESYCSRRDWLQGLGHLAVTAVVQADMVHEHSEQAIVKSIISWTGIGSIQVEVMPAASDRLFMDEKTYFLIGLTGDVGLSLCEWMTDHGAKYVAIASRHPTIPQGILQYLQKKGLTIRIFSLDIADDDNLRNVHQEIVASMPPIAGVVNAALIVRDHPFDGMALEDLEAVFRPKVVGTLNLDQLFFSTPLDFFILFSSAASIVGKPAQSGYNAANLFMSTVAARRRKRGFSASVMHFGMLLGFGFIHGQAGPITEARFRQDDLLAIPEPDFHEIFAQAIVSGRPESDLNPEIIAGLGTEINTPWRAMPRFGHCLIKGAERSGDQGRDPKQSSQSIKDRLKGACDSKHALSILKATIASRVTLALGSPGEGVNEHVGLVNLGLDSLVAVEIRSWLLKILEIEVPVLKLLSGSSLLDLCQYVLSILPNQLKPWDEGKYDDRKKGSEEIDKVSPASSTQSFQIEPPRNNVAGPTILDLEGSNERFVLGVTGEPSIPSPAHTERTIYVKTGQPQVSQTEFERVGNMSHSQAQLYFLHEYLQNNAYNVAYTGRFHGQLNMARLQEALRIVGKRHEGLRSAYFMDIPTARPVQAVLPEPRTILTFRAVSDSSQVQTEIDGVKDFKFEIEQGVFMKIVVMSHSPSLHSILFIHHHIALDGIAWTVFISELAGAYSGCLGSTLAHPGKQQSIDMAERQLKELTLQNSHADLVFWKNTYKSIPTPLPLFPFAKVKSRPTVKDYSINTSDAKLSRGLTRLVNTAASEIGVTPFHFYLASLAVFLSRCIGINDISIGIVDSNRREVEDMGTIGYFLNMLPVRIMLEHFEPFDKVARRSRDAALAAMAHSRAPIDMIIGQLGIPRSTSHHPLFQVAINYRKAPLNETDFGQDGKIKWDGAVPGGNPYDVLLNVAETSDWTFISLITQRNLYEADDGALLLKWYTRALEALARNPSSEAGKCPISNDADIVEAIELGRGSCVETPWSGTLTDRVDEVVTEVPHNIAIKDDQGQTLTYTQMTTRMNELTGKLQAISESFTPGSYVAMLLDPAADAICCILAILRLGLVWIPLDTKNHPQRLRTIVKETRPRILVCHDATKDLMQQICVDVESISILNIDSGDHDSPRDEKNNIPAPLDTPKRSTCRKSQPAMILYTSGSTGVPKGVLLTHWGLLNQIYGTIVTLCLGRETTLQQSPLGFDLMIDQIFLALCNGGTIVMVGKAGRGDPTYIADLMVRHSVTLTHFVPSEYLTLLNYGQPILTKAHAWRYAMSGGERLGPELRKAFHKLDCPTLKLVNVYGPAEITVACARGIVPYRRFTDVRDSSGDYLYPSPNYGIEITDADMNVLPVGFPGEICISGENIGLGYFERPEESSLKFIERESISPSSPATKVYRSGDKGRLLPDGTLQVLGRMDGDRQVKIHGFRVELGEVANAIVHMSNGTIANAAASWRPDQQAGILIVFVVFDVGFAGARSDFLEWLRSNLPLPSVMKPNLMVPIDRIPATANGKIDMGAVDDLPIPKHTDSSNQNAYAPRLSQWEKLVKDLWEETLWTRTVDISRSGQKQESIQPSSDFFQVGGSSILMIKLKSLLEVQFDTTFSMPELFHASTLSRMATVIENSMDTNAISAVPPTTASFLAPRGTRQVIKWELEMASMADGLPQPRSISSLPDQRLLDGGGGLIIILTGATGFIGRHLLSHLIKDSRVAQVHCLAIRPDASGRPRNVSVKSNKIIEYMGDLSTLSLGLSDSQFASLADRAHVIIHNGADVSLLKTYQSLRRANVVSTRTLCEMATPRRVPLHYVSTASVAKVVRRDGGGGGGDDDDDEPLLEVPASPAAPDLLNSVDGYAASKWASEMLLERAVADNGLPAYIYRLAHVMGDDASELDAIGMLIKYSLLLRALPRIAREDVVGKWDFVMAEEVTRDLVASALKSVTGGDGDSLPHQPSLQTQQRARPIYINQCSPIKIAHEGLRGYLERMAGGPLQEIDMKDWLVAAHQRGLDTMVLEFFTAFDKGKGKMVLPIIAKGR